MKPTLKISIIKTNIVPEVLKMFRLYNIKYGMAATKKHIRELDGNVDVILVARNLILPDKLKLNGDANYVLNEVFHQFGWSNSF